MPGYHRLRKQGNPFPIKYAIGFFLASLCWTIAVYNFVGTETAKTQIKTDRFNSDLYIETKPLVSDFEREASFAFTSPTTLIAKLLAELASEFLKLHANRFKNVPKATLLLHDVPKPDQSTRRRRRPTL